ncbi:MAG: hypothetical protein AAGJ52_12495, partial [Pseudomonadota bacterium]
MLKTRVITALIIAVLVMAALFALNSTPFAVVAAVVLLGIGGWEAGRLGGLRGNASCWLFGAALLLVGLIVGQAIGLMNVIQLNFDSGRISIPQLLLIPAALWLALLCWLAQPSFGDHESGP